MFKGAPREPLGGDDYDDMYDSCDSDAQREPYDEYVSDDDEVNVVANKINKNVKQPVQLKRLLFAKTKPGDIPIKLPPRIRITQQYLVVPRYTCKWGSEDETD